MTDCKFKGIFKYSLIVIRHARQVNISDPYTPHTVTHWTWYMLTIAISWYYASFIQFFNIAIFEDE